MLCSQSEANFYARRLLSGYPSANPPDPQFYLAGVVEILTKHELSVVRQACEGGVQSVHPTFLPTHGEISNWASRKSNEEAKGNYYAALPAPENDKKEYRKWNLFVPASVNGYDSAVELTKSAEESEYKFEENHVHKDGTVEPGVWIPWQWWEEKVRGKVGAR